MYIPRIRALPLLLCALFAGPLLARTPAAARAAGARYRVTDLGEASPDLARNLIRINNKGEALVSHTTGAGSQTDPQVTHIFLWQAGKQIPVPLQQAMDLNDRAQIVGEAEAGAEPAGRWGDTARPVLWENGKRTILDRQQPGTGLAISNTGHVAGRYWTGMADSVSGFHWKAGKATPLGSEVAADVNDRGRLVGSDYEGRACFWQNGRKRLLSRENSAAVAINNKNQVVGVLYHGGDGSTRAVLWTAAGKRRDLGALPGRKNVRPAAINDRGQVVGSAAGPNGGPSDTHAFLWERGAMTDLNARLAPDSGWVLHAAQHLNERGQIVGVGSLAGKPRFFLLTPR